MAPLPPSAALLALLCLLGAVTGERWAGNAFCELVWMARGPRSLPASDPQRPPGSLLDVAGPASGLQRDPVVADLVRDLPCLRRWRAGTHACCAGPRLRRTMAPPNSCLTRRACAAAAVQGGWHRRRAHRPPPGRRQPAALLALSGHLLPPAHALPAAAVPVALLPTAHTCP